MNSDLMVKNPKEIIKEIYKLNIKLRVLESNIEGYLGNGRNISHAILNKCLMESREISKNRLSDCDKLRKRSMEIRTKIIKFKASIEHIEPNEEFVRSIKEVMEDIEALLTEMKRDQKDDYDNLLRSEVALWQECVFVEKKIDAWDSGDHDKEVESLQKPSIAAAMASRVATDENNAIAALQKFLDETGGKTGGWAAIDHQTFLRVRLKYTGVHGDAVSCPRDEAVFVADLASLLAPKTAADISGHEAWYRRYEQLLAAKRLAIAAWREHRAQQAAIADDAADDTEQAAGQAGSSRTAEGEAQKRDRLEKQKRALDAWRTEKALEEYRRKLEQDNAAKAEIERSKQQRERERQEMRLVVDQYKQRKQTNEADRRQLEFELTQLEKGEKMRRLELDSARIHERSTRMVEERILLQHRRQFESEQRTERLDAIRSAVAVTARRDPSRLLRPTSAWAQRRLADSAAEQQSLPVAGVRIGSVQHKAVPSWRRDL